MINKVILVGRLGNNPELRHTQSGKAVISFSLATNESWKDAKGEKKETVEWHNVTAWDKLAEVCDKFLTKGKQVYIEGKIKTEKFTDKNGVEKYSTKIIADTVKFLGDLKDHASQQANGSPQTSSQEASDDDLPF